MSLLKPKRIEDLIVERLAKGPLRATKLVLEIQRLRHHTTKQAVYAALRQQKAREEVVVYKGTAALNITWLNRLTRFATNAKLHYTSGEATGDDITNLSPGDRITYHFQNPLKADVFWTHAFYLLAEQAPHSEPVYLYNPHEWFLLARHENETEVIRTVTNQGRQFLLLAGHSTPLDKYVRQYFDGERGQYHTLPRPHFKKNNYYLNVFGNVLLEVWLDKKMSNAIDDFYQRSAAWNGEAGEHLTAILKQNRRLRITISHNKTKAEAYKKFCRKFFYIPK